MQYPMTWNPDAAYKLTKDIALRLAYGGSALRSHMEGNIKVIDEFKLHSVSLVEAPAACKECGYPAFGCPFVRGSNACTTRRGQWSPTQRFDSQVQNVSNTPKSLEADNAG